MTFSGDRPVVRSRTGGSSGSSTTASAVGTGAPRPGDTLEVGSQATRYEILRCLGTGGTAEVFLARRLGPAGFARPVALKCILAGLDEDEATRRAFMYEAQLASKLRHPNIAEAYDLALVGDRYYLVLEYIDGVTLRAAFRAARATGRRLSEAFCCHVISSVAEALHHAHTLADEDGKPLGIIHRDVTAVNVMIARSGAVKLLDFGVALARLEGRERTRTGQFRGTFVYASPEQASSVELDGRSDLFSLGVVLVEMLTGVRVFEADTDIGTMRKIVECRPEEVEAATAALPRELAAICARALARRPADRFQDGAAFSCALREYLTARGITYSPSDCAAELRSLGLFASPPEADVAVPRDGDASGAAAVSGGITAAPDERAAARSSRRVWRRWPAVAAVAAALLVAGAVKLFPHSGRRATAPPIVASTSAVEPSSEREVAAALRPTVDPPPPAATGPEERTDPETIVRARRPRAAARAATLNVAKPTPPPGRREHPTVRTTSALFADRATVGSPRATLPRGTLVPAKLVRALAGPNPGRAEAVVTEEVAADGVVLVPKGSTVSCSARPPAGGRVPLSCDAINTSDRVLTFSGVAVGEGQRVGLRLLDEEIAAGTPFVVYVSAPAALR